MPPARKPILDGADFVLGRSLRLESNDVHAETGARQAFHVRKNLGLSERLGHSGMGHVERAQAFA
jgi:hypothetical protein